MHMCARALAHVCVVYIGNYMQYIIYTQNKIEQRKLTRRTRKASLVRRASAAILSLCLALSAHAPETGFPYFRNSSPSNLSRFSFVSTFTLALCTLRNPLEDPPALPWIRTITSSAMRGSVCTKGKQIFFFFYNIVYHISSRIRSALTRS